MKQTCHSEYGTIRSIYIKSVSDAFVSDEKISKEWRELNFLGKPDLQKAKQEYEVFESLLQHENRKIHYFPAVNSVSIDSIYCRDAAIATDHGMIICNMGKPARVHEPEAQKISFEQLNLTILGSIQSPGTIEGGDVAWLDEKTIAIGHTYRTNEEGIYQMKKLLGPLGIEIVVVDLPHYKGAGDVFHLMSIFSPVDKDLAVIYSPLMPIAFRNYLLKRGYTFVEVPDEEFESMGCNVLAIAPRTCVMVADNQKTKSLLEKNGCTVQEYEGNEISVKGGGGPTCLTRPLWREV